MHTPHFQHGTCILRPSTHYTLHCPAATLHYCNSPLTPPRPVHCHLSFTSDSSESDQDPDSTPEHSDEEEDFQTVPMDDEHWTTDIVHLKEHFVYMKMGYPTMYVNTHALMGIVTLPHIWTA